MKIIPVLAVAIAYYGHAHAPGEIPANLGDLAGLQSLDVTGNRLSGGQIGGQVIVGEDSRQRNV